MARSGLSRAGAPLAALLALSACGDGGFDLDLRRDTTLNTSEAAARAVAPRPLPDNRGVISYPTYQVVVANPGETVADVAARLGLNGAELARYNGLPADVPLRGGEAVVLPTRVAEPSPATGAIATGPIQPASAVSIETLAGDAINRAEGPSAASRLAPTGQEPQRHRVGPGETAFSIARAYGVPVSSVADWNGLTPDLAVREGQFLLIPPAPTRVAALEPSVSAPGEATSAPLPQSAAKPLPKPETTVAASVAPEPPKLEDTRTSASNTAQLGMPVQGKIARPYTKGSSDGIGISASPGADVVAADAGTVAAITRDTNQVPIIVLRHAGNLLTVYAGVEGVAVKKGDQVRRGQKIGQVRDADPALLHFEVREGFESVDPMPFLG